jgi:hypothetical protein
MVGTRHGTGDGIGGASVYLVRPGGVEPQRGCTTASVTEPSGHGSQVDAGH